MAEIRRGYESGGPGERLPWLEPVEDEDYGDEPAGPRGRVLLLILALALVAALAGGYAWLTAGGGAAEDVGGTIRAEPGPYKVRAPANSGMPIASAGAVAERTGIGGDINSPLDLGAIPEQPVVGPGSPDAARAEEEPPVPVASPAPTRAAPTAAPAPVARPAAEAPRPAPRPVPVAAAPVRAEAATGAIQLGAFSTEAKARAAWKSLSKRFGFLEGMAETISPVKSGETTLYRLRASGAGTGQACQRLRVAGESCTAV